MCAGSWSYAAIWRADPICYREAAINARGRAALDRQVANWLKVFALGFHAAHVFGGARRHLASRLEFRFGGRSMKAIIGRGSNRPIRMGCGSER